MKNKKVIIILVLALVIIIAVFGIKIYFASLIPQENFKAPGQTWQSSKRVEDYFVEHMRVSQGESVEMAKNGVEFRVSKGTTLKGIVSNLTYYGLVRDEKALVYALENTKDTTPGRSEGIKVSTSGTIDIEATYEFDKNMNTWEVANILLNKPFYWDDSTRYDYLFMLGDPHGPKRERTTN